MYRHFTMSTGHPEPIVDVVEEGEENEEETEDEESEDPMPPPPKRNIIEWMDFGLRIGLNAALHPFEYAKVLMQLGYEPIPPRPAKSVVGNSIMVLPNVFQYAGHICKTDGLLGCYRGMPPRILGAVLAALMSERFATFCGISMIPERERFYDESSLTKSRNELWHRFEANLKRDLVLTVSGVIVAQPFNVISLRMMAQFVGRETLYDSLVGSIAEIYQQEGLGGFFSGLAPKMLSDISCLLLSSVAVYIINKHIVKDKIGRQYNACLTRFTCASVLYPMQVVATTMAVTGARIEAGQPPMMPLYRSWTRCFKDMGERNLLKRGSSLFLRTIEIHSDDFIPPTEEKLRPVQRARKMPR